VKSRLLALADDLPGCSAVALFDISGTPWRPVCSIGEQMAIDGLEVMFEAAGAWREAGELVVQGASTQVALASGDRLLLLRAPAGSNVGLAIALGRAFLQEASR
jgi:hypothetical protein